MTKPIPDIVVGRLPIYLRALSFLAAEGTQVTSSHDLGKRQGISAARDGTLGAPEGRGGGVLRVARDSR